MWDLWWSLFVFEEGGEGLIGVRVRVGWVRGR